MVLIQKEYQNSTFAIEIFNKEIVIKRILFPFLLFVFVVTTYGQNSLQGIVTDAENNESVIGCNIMLQGTSIGTITDLNGAYTFKNLSAGTYNVVFSFISYEKQIQKVTITKGGTITSNIKLKPATTQIKDVVVTGTRRTDTELSLLMNNKVSALTVNGISSQQIARSQDKDASEVIRRIPGVSIRDGKFVIVRGLTERYNSVWLNGSTTPSSESDVRAFSFDVIPSGQIDNILIYKSAAPELPADFAGAMINIKTKSLIDKNSITFSYSYGYREGTTGKDFFTYQGGKTDWLGYDDGTRGIPKEIGSFLEFREKTNIPNSATSEEQALIEKNITNLSKTFNKILSPTQKTASPDADFQLGINRRFTIGPFSIGSISSLGYNSTNTYQNSMRAKYGSDGMHDYIIDQHSFANRIRLSALSNWMLLFGNNQKIEFRNLFNSYGMSRTLFNNVNDSVNQSFQRNYELSYESRMTYSGQLAGNHVFNDDNSKLDWTIGYSYANKNQPDIRRVSSFLSWDADNPKFILQSPGPLTRLYLDNIENQKNIGINYSQKFNLGNFKPEIKTGLLVETKDRQFNARVFEFTPKNNRLDRKILSYNDSSWYTTNMMNSISTYLDSIDYKKGGIYNDITDMPNSYSAKNELYAAYLALNIPFNKYANLYFGARVEKNNTALYFYKKDGINTNKDTLKRENFDVFPSVNFMLNLSKNLLIRISGGKTVNRPEFREVSKFAFYNFEENTFTYGNQDLKNCYITNGDLRFEWYPTSEEIVSLGGFYKNFENPIENHALYSSSGWYYGFANADHAKSYGLELDIRKNLHELRNAEFLSFLSNFTFVVNASIIKSEIKVLAANGQTSITRELQGQSPYIINIGTYYQDSKLNLMASLMYNKVGKRISYIGDENQGAITPNLYEMPFNSLDFTFEKKITKWANLKLGIKNLLDDDVVFLQTDVNPNSTTHLPQSIDEVRQKYKPGMQIKLGISMVF
jgi:TonB-dependent receptor